MNKLLQDYNHLAGFGHRVDISGLRETTREWPSDVLVDREEIVQKIGRVNALLDEVEEAERSSSYPFPNYNNTVTKQKTTARIRDHLNLDSGPVQVLLNGEVLVQALDISGSGGTVNLSLRPGANTLTVVSLDPDCTFPDTYELEFANNLYGPEKHVFMLHNAGQSQSWTVGLPLITLDGSKYPESARHLHDYLTNHAAGVGDDGIWTIDRNKPEQNKRRDKALGIYIATEGNDPISPISDFDRDELPMAFFKEGGLGFVRPIPASDNRGSGPNFTGQTRRYGPERKLIPDGHDVQVQAINIGWSKSRVGTSGNDTLRGVNGVDYMYGLAGRDTLRGFGGDDIMFGGQDEDNIAGQEGNDQLYGNAGNDFLHGGHGNDTLTGGLGIDTLVGGTDEKKVFVLQKGMPYRGDLVDDFQVGTDRIGILRSDFSTLGNFSFRNGVWPPRPASQGAWIQWQGQDMMFLNQINASQLNNGIFEYQ